MMKELLIMKTYEFKLIKFFIDDMFYRMITLNIILFGIDLCATIALILGFLTITPINIGLTIFGTLFLSKEKKEKLFQEYKEKNEEMLYNINLIKMTLLNI